MRARGGDEGSVFQSGPLLRASIEPDDAMMGRGREVLTVVTVSGRDLAGWRTGSTSNADVSDDGERCRGTLTGTKENAAILALDMWDGTKAGTCRTWWATG